MSHFPRLTDQFLLAMSVWLVSIVILSACSSSISVPLSDRSSDAKPRPEYIVRSGDTLYTIAWVTRLDPNDLADWNSLYEPYRLQPGQRLVLYGNSAARSSQAEQPADRSKPSNRPIAKPSDSTASQAKSTLKGERDALGPWFWPSDGKTVSAYSPKDGQQGIDLAGPFGAPVRSVARGRVVYAGTGLRGYGRLMIIKHGKSLLSAYGNNAELLVAEHEEVEAGQQIATVGNSDNGRSQLHFELRHHGKPIDPTRILPSRE